MTPEAHKSDVLKSEDMRHETIKDIRARMGVYRPGDLRGDHSLNPDTGRPPPPYRAAAVLIPLLVREDGVHVVFTLRTAHLHAHAGQVSFPGGGADPEDDTPVATALREAQEEIGLAPEHVEILGVLDPYITRTGYQVQPVVGLIRGNPDWAPDDFEVAEIFDVPLDHLRCGENLAQRTVMYEGVPRHYYACTWERFEIWGATAGMLRNFIEVITHE